MIYSKVMFLYVYRNNFFYTIIVRMTKFTADIVSLDTEIDKTV